MNVVGFDDELGNKLGAIDGNAFGTKEGDMLGKILGVNEVTRLVMKTVTMMVEH